MSVTSPGRSVPHGFYLAMAAFALLVVFVGFAPTYYLSGQFDGPALTPLVQLHGLVFTTWMLLFGVQTTLVATHRTHVHRRLGIVGALVAFAMVVIGVVTAIASARRGHTPLPVVPPLAFLAVPIADMVVFGVLVSTAVAMRRRADFHARLMLLATITILGPAFARIRIDAVQDNNPASFMVLVTLTVVACAGWDAMRRARLHPVYLWGGLLVILSQPLRLAIARTDAWMAFARWLTA